MKRHTQTTFNWHEKEEVMEASQSSVPASMSKLKVTTFFPLQKLKGSQLTITPSTRVCTWKKRVPMRRRVWTVKTQMALKVWQKSSSYHLARAVKDARQMEKHCYHCDRPDHFIHNCPWLEEMTTGSSLNQKEGTVPRKGGWAPQVKVVMPKVPQDGTPKA